MLNILLSVFGLVISVVCLGLILKRTKIENKNDKEKINKPILLLLVLSMCINFYQMLVHFIN